MTGVSKRRNDNKISSKCLTIFLISLFFTSVIGITAFGYSSYTSHITGPLSSDCTVCHPAGDMTSLNPYGTAFESISGHASTPGDAIADIADIDSDGDGYTNGWELESGTYPGDSSSVPSGVSPKAVISEPSASSLFSTNIDISFDGTGSHDEFGIKTAITLYEWDFGDGNTLQGQTVVHSYSLQDTYTVSLTVTSASGLTDTTSISVIISNVDVNIPPIAIISDSTDSGGSVGGIMQFDAIGSFDPNDDMNNNGTIDDSETDNLTYSWNFGDGSTGSGKIVEHIYSSLGTFNVVLTATDNGYKTDTVKLSSTDTLNVTLLAPYLNIVNFSKSSSNSVAGEKLVIYCQINNTGEGDAYFVTASLYDDERAIEHKLTNITILSNETRSVVFTTYLETGNHRLNLDINYSLGSQSEKLYVHIESEPENIPFPGLASILIVISLLALTGRIRHMKRRNE